MKHSNDWHDLKRSLAAFAENRAFLLKSRQLIALLLLPILAFVVIEHF